MGRVFNLLLLTAMIVGAVVTYNMKHKAEIAADKVARLQAEVAAERDQITLLNAEWSVLTQPARLQAVVEKYADHFRLQPFAPDQIATIDQIPLRPVGANGPVSRALAGIAAGGTTGVR